MSCGGVPSTFVLSNPCLGDGEVSVLMLLPVPWFTLLVKPGALSLPVLTRVCKDISDILTK
jgi:hypothetical protein